MSKAEPTLNYETPPPTSAPAPGARTALTLLLAINLFNYVDRYVLAAAEPEIQKHMFKPGDPNAEALMGSLATAFMVSYMVMAPVLGWLADRMSRWVLVGVSVIAWSLASGASGMAQFFTMLLITRLFVGIGEAGYGPAAPTIISDLYPVSHRGSVLSWFYAAIPVGSALGFVIGGLITQHFSWQMAFYAVVPPGLLQPAPAKLVSVTIPPFFAPRVPWLVQLLPLRLRLPPFSAVSVPSFFQLFPLRVIVPPL